LNHHCRMGFIKFGVLAMLLTASGAARADMIYLTCANVIGPVNYTIDTANGTANNLHATINPTAIDWDEPLGSGSPGLTAVRHNHIDRAAGTWSSAITYNNNGQTSTGNEGPFPCTAGAAPATKF
jgi:hypothetical protein